jgi:hypothetical protein
MDTGNIQILFFQHLRMQLPSHISLAEEIADLLNISTDSAYRRIRGEKPMAFEELQKLCQKYKISLDQLFHLNSNSILFSGFSGNQHAFEFKDYLRHALQQLQHMNSFEKRGLFYLTRDIPIFHHFHCRKLAAFKCFFWMRTVMNDPHLLHKTFAEEIVDPEILDYGRQLVDAYSQLPSTEIWNTESLTSTLRQIDYYREAQLFANPDDADIVYDELIRSIDHIEEQAELGYKTSIDGEKHYPDIPFRIYINDFVIGENTLLAVLNDSRITFLVHSVFNYLHTHDKAFNDLTYRHFQNIIRKSTLISESGEKERVRFFSLLRQRIHERKEAIL